MIGGLVSGALSGDITGALKNVGSSALQKLLGGLGSFFLGNIS